QRSHPLEVRQLDPRLPDPPYPVCLGAAHAHHLAVHPLEPSVAAELQRCRQRARTGELSLLQRSDAGERSIERRGVGLECQKQQGSKWGWGCASNTREADRHGRHRRLQLGVPETLSRVTTERKKQRLQWKGVPAHPESESYHSAIVWRERSTALTPVSAQI